MSQRLCVRTISQLVAKAFSRHASQCPSAGASAVASPLCFHRPYSSAWVHYVEVLCKHRVPGLNSSHLQSLAESHSLASFRSATTHCTPVHHVSKTVNSATSNARQQIATPIWPAIHATHIQTPLLRPCTMRRYSSRSGHGTAGDAQLRARIAAQQRRSSDQGLYLVAIVVGMVGLTYASVPLYRLFCQATGYGGTVQQGATVEAKLRKRAEHRDDAMEAAAAQCDLTIYFSANTADGMPWVFTPTQRMVKLKPGQSTLAFYTAYNPTDKAITGVSTYNVAPQKAGYYFNKIQCFCFEEQKLRPGEKIDMPVFFYVDPEFAVDPRLKGVDNLTLSYTFFKVDEEKETPAEALTRILAEHPDQQSELMPRHVAKQ